MGPTDESAADADGARTTAAPVRVSRDAPPARMRAARPGDPAAVGSPPRRCFGVPVGDLRSAGNDGMEDSYDARCCASLWGCGEGPYHFADSNDEPRAT